MTTTGRIIGVIGIGDVPETALKVIAAHITGYLNLQSEILPALEHPSFAHDPKRLQYDAGKILKALESMPFTEYEKVIGVLDLDLFVPIFTHVFGEARQGGKYALVSLCRLGKGSGDRNPPSPLLLERAAKVALHELGHLFDQLHCEDHRCIMHFSGRSEDLDNTPLYFCRYCSASLHDHLRRTHPEG